MRKSTDSVPMYNIPLIFDLVATIVWLEQLYFEGNNDCAFNTIWSGDVASNKMGPVVLRRTWVVSKGKYMGNGRTVGQLGVVVLW